MDAVDGDVNADAMDVDVVVVVAAAVVGVAFDDFHTMIDLGQYRIVVSDVDRMVDDLVEFAYANADDARPIHA